MKIEIDARKKDDSAGPFFAIRLYPENNDEMRQMEWGLAIGMVPSGRIERISVGDEFHYVIPFSREDKG